MKKQRLSTRKKICGRIYICGENKCYSLKFPNIFDDSVAKYPAVTAKGGIILSFSPKLK
jgi:hypothetical protein